MFGRPTGLGDPLAGLMMVALTACAGGGGSPTGGSFALTSPAFASDGAIPARHTCDGPDLSPALAWTAPPAGTAAFALVVEDPDAGGFVHWVVPGIDGAARGLPEGVPVDGPPTQGRNDFGRRGWSGPCPPSGTHHYVFTLYALRAAPAPGLALAPSADELRRAMQGTILGEARLVGSYAR